MKYFLSSLILLIGLFNANAQTHEIAHKSHSGSLASLDRSGPDWFGAIESPPLIKIERIQTKNDTATIVYYGYSLENTEEIRVANHPIFNRPNVNIDSLRAAYDGSVIFVGFDDIESEKEDKKKEWIMPIAWPSDGITPKLMLFTLLLLFAGLWSRSNRTAVA